MIYIYTTVYICMYIYKYIYTDTHAAFYRDKPTYVSMRPFFGGATTNES